MTLPKVAVFGAGATGCFLAGELLMASVPVSLICRDRIKAAIETNQGIHLTDYQGLNIKVMPSAIYTDGSETSEIFDVIFVTVKCHHLPHCFEALRKLTRPSSVIILMQNGLGSLDMVSQSLKDRTILQGITPFNVLSQTSNHYHKSTEGGFYFPTHPLITPLVQAIKYSDLPCQSCEDINAIVNGKLLLNLNNALNAISDLPLKEELQQRKFRQILAQAMKEWLNICHKAKLPIASLSALPNRFIPTILQLPDFLFQRVARKTIDIDPLARSSMWEDIQAKRTTEIEYINGAVVKLGQKYGVATPVNLKIYQAIKSLEKGEKINLFDEI